MTQLEFKVCTLTPGGRGAVATIGVRGSLLAIADFFQAANGRATQQQTLDRICFGLWGNTAPEEVLLVRIDEDAAEIHCHGGIAAVGRILQNLSEAGGTVVAPEDWTQADSLSGEAESQRALLRATTVRTAHHLLRQSQLWAPAIKRLEEMTADQRQLEIDNALHWSNFGLHLTQPWKVVLCGRPNVGKSSLINALVGYARTIVFDQPGTTRDVVAVETAFEGWPVELSDTAGLRTTEHELESAGIARAQARLNEADVIVIVLDATDREQTEENELMSRFPDAIVFRNKSDLTEDNAGTADSHSAHRESSANRTLSGSALTGEGIPELIQHIVKRIVPEVPPDSAFYPVTDGQTQQLIAMKNQSR